MYLRMKMGLVWWNIRSYKMHLRQLKLRRGPSMCHFQLSLAANTRKQLRNQSGRISLKIASWTNKTMFNISMYIIVPCLHHSGSTVYFMHCRHTICILVGDFFQLLLLQVALLCQWVAINLHNEGANWIIHWNGLFKNANSFKNQSYVFMSESFKYSLNKFIQKHRFIQECKKWLSLWMSHWTICLKLIKTYCEEYLNRPFCVMKRSHGC